MGAEAVWGLVSGLPSAKRGTRLLMPLQAYIDDSTQAGSVLVLAGYIADAAKWAVFSDDWQRLLDMAPRWPYLKMSEIALSADEVRWERAMFHYRAIERHAHAAVCCAISIPTLNKVADELSLPDIIRNPYFIASKAIVNLTAQFQDRMGLSEPVDFIFDKQTESRVIASVWEGYVESLSPYTRVRTGEPPIFRDDREFLPLQAADLWAWWMRKKYVDTGSILGTEFPFPGNIPLAWKPQRNILRLLLEPGEDELRREFLKNTAVADFRPTYAITRADFRLRVS